MGAPKEKEVTENHFNPNYLFDYLVSPIKVDYEFGPIKNPITSRAVVIERNRDFWNRHLHFRETLRLDGHLRRSAGNWKLHQKTLMDVVKFYNMWKLTSHYKFWKQAKNALKKQHLKVWN